MDKLPQNISIEKGQTLQNIKTTEQEKIKIEEEINKVQIIYEDHNITNMDFYKLIQKTAHWLNDEGVKPKENVLIQDIGFPQTILLLYGLWHLGARAVILEKINREIDNNLPIKIITLENA